MKFTCSVDINAPIEMVVALFEDPNNLVEWQDGYLGMQLLSGEEGQPGAKTKLKYKVGRRTIDLIETLEVNNLPTEFRGTYEADTMVNTMIVNFIDLGNGYTRYNSYIHYTEIRGFFVKILVTLMPGLFKKQVQKWSNQFRDFVESEVV